MENTLKTKLEEVINHLEEETKNIVSRIKLDTPQEKERTKEILVTMTTTLWLKYCLQNNLSYQELEIKSNLLEEVINDPRYQNAGKMSQISYLAAQIAERISTSEDEITRIIDMIKKLDENSFYINNDNPLRSDYAEDLIIKRCKKISSEAAKDSAKLMKILLADENFMEKLKKSGYRIDENFLKPEAHQEDTLLGQIKISEEVSNRINKILKEIKPRNLK